MTGKAGVQAVRTVSDLYVLAYRMEADAAERYGWLADQMQIHNSPELARIFGELARAEASHRDEIQRLAGPELDLEAEAEAVTRWSRDESPEAADLGAAHYLMTPRSALEMALAGEERAVEFFDGLLHELQDPEVRRLAQEMLEEEIQHVELCHRLLRQYPAPRSRWVVEDPDPPVSQE